MLMMQHRRTRRTSAARLSAGCRSPVHRLVSVGILLISAFVAAWPAAAASFAESSSGVTTTLRFVSWKPDHPRMWDEAIRRFTARYPHIRIEREIAPHSSTAYHDLLTQKLKNRDATVDLFFMDVIWVPEFAAAGWARPLDARFTPVMQAEFMPSTVEVGRYRTQVYGVPSRIDAGMLYYRADLLDKYALSPPRTWRELVQQAQTILAGERASSPTLRGYSAQFKQYEGLVCNMLEVIGSHGGTLIDGDQQVATLSSAATLDALEFVRTEVLGPLASRATLTYQEPESLAAFLRGNAIFHRNWPYAWELANNPEHSSVAGRVGVTALPGSADHHGVAALGGWLLGISALSSHPEEAWLFIDFLTSHTMQREFALQAGIAPSRTALYQDPELLAANPQWRHQFAVLQSAIPRPRSPVYPALSHILQRYFSRALAYPDLVLLPEARLAEQELNRLLALTASEAP